MLKRFEQPEEFLKIMKNYPKELDKKKELPYQLRIYI